MEIIIGIIAFVIGAGGGAGADGHGYNEPTGSTDFDKPIDVQYESSG